MQGLIAVEKNLSRLAELIEAEGYQVVDLDDTDLTTVDAILVSGADNNLMNIQDTVSEVPVIDVSGKSAQDILNTLERL